MRSRNNNFKVKGVAQNVLRGVGISSTGVLVLLGIIAISPITNKADAANGWDEELKNYRESASTVTLSMDSGTNSVVNAGNTNTNVGVVKRTASVTLGNTNGYSVYIRANSANLTGSNSSNTIPSITSNSTLSQMTDKWGWNGSVGDNVTDCSLSDVFKQMTTSNQTLGSGGAVSSGTKKVTMCFGTRVSEAKVADTYSNTVTLSVVAQPGRTATFNGITTMQQMTSTICSAANYHETAQLTDARDNKKYWVTKLLDGNCWMSQNLDLDITTSNVTAATSDVTSNWTTSSTYPARATVTVNSTTINYDAENPTSTYSWNPGDYIVISPTTYQKVSSGGKSLSEYSERVMPIGSRVPSTDPNFYKKNGATYNASEYDAHYLVGNYYQWNTATAGTGGTIANASASGSICPKGWKLPLNTYKNTSGSYVSIGAKSFPYLLQQYGLNGISLTGTSPINSNTYNIALAPLFFVRSGYLVAGDGLYDVGRGAGLLSSRAGDYDGTMESISWELSISDSVTYWSGRRFYGDSVRCVSPAS